MLYFIKNYVFDYRGIYPPCTPRYIWLLTPHPDIMGANSHLPAPRRLDLQDLEYKSVGMHHSDHKPDKARRGEGGGMRAREMNK